jgi:hypothetical protein
VAAGLRVLVDGVRESFATTPVEREDVWVRDCASRLSVPTVVEELVTGRCTLVVDSTILGANTAALGLNEGIVTCSE